MRKKRFPLHLVSSSLGQAGEEGQRVMSMLQTGQREKDRMPSSDLCKSEIPSNCSMFLIKPYFVWILATWFYISNPDLNTLSQWSHSKVINLWALSMWFSKSDSDLKIHSQWSHSTVTTLRHFQCDSPNLIQTWKYYDSGHTQKLFLSGQSFRVRVTFHGFTSSVLSSKCLFS